MKKLRNILACIRPYIYEWVDEVGIIKPWMGCAQMNWWNHKTLMILMPFHIVYAWYKKLYEWMLIGHHYSCRDCKDMALRIRKLEIELSIEKDLYTTATKKMESFLMSAKK